MPLFFMHLRDGEDVLLDDDGLEIAVDEVPEAALKAARDCIAGDVLAGRIDLACSIDVQDENGAIVHTLPFAEAVVIIDPATRKSPAG